MKWAAPSVPNTVDPRIRDVRTMYETRDVGQVTELLAKYSVEYVYVGAAERLYFPEEGIAKFDAMVGTVLQVVFTNGDATVYRVLPSEGLSKGLRGG